MTPWIKIVPADQIVDGKEYLIGSRPVMSCYDPVFLSKDAKGKDTWNAHPGAATRYIGGDELRANLRKNTRLCQAIEVPEDAHKLWKQRTPRRKAAQGEKT